jgi:hypothetical protein
MGHLVFHRFGGRRGNISSLSINYYRGCLCCGDIELEGSYVGLISMKLISMGTFIGTSSRHMAQALTVQVSSSRDSLLAFLRC